MTTDKPIWSVYMIRTVDDRLYSGVSTDVARRYGEHLAGGPRAAKYLKAHKPHSLVFCMPIGSRSLSQKVEYHLKRLSRDQKETVIKKQMLAFDAETGKITVSPICDGVDRDAV
jgi:putative endonuclease